jgi:hypothetical protein
MRMSSLLVACGKPRLATLSAHCEQLLWALSVPTNYNLELVTDIEQEANGFVLALIDGDGAIVSQHYSAVALPSDPFSSMIISTRLALMAAPTLPKSCTTRLETMLWMSIRTATHLATISWFRYSITWKDSLIS